MLYVMRRLQFWRPLPQSGLAGYTYDHYGFWIVQLSRLRFWTAISGHFDTAQHFLYTMCCPNAEIFQFSCFKSSSPDLKRVWQIKGHQGAADTAPTIYPSFDEVDCHLWTNSLATHVHYVSDTLALDGGTWCSFLMLVDDWLLKELLCSASNLHFYGFSNSLR